MAAALQLTLLCLSLRVSAALPAFSRESLSAAVEDLRLSPPLSSLTRGIARYLLSARPALSAAGASPTRDSTYCPNASAFDLVPLTVANVSQGGGVSTSWGGDGCFGSLSATVSWPAGGGVSIVLKGDRPATLVCGDVYLLATSYSLSIPVEVSALSPSATLSLPAWSAEEAVDVSLHGVTIGLLPCGVLGSLASLLATVNIFSPLSGKVGDLVASNSAFLNGRGVWSGEGGKGSPLTPFGRVTPLNGAWVWVWGVFG
jgi:hypothetical protein